MSKLQGLFDHPFVEVVLTKGVAAQRLLGDRSPSKVIPEYAREPDEHEYFLMRVGACMAELLSLCRQLDQIPILLTNHRQTPAMDKADITRHSAIVYHLENYIIRTQGVLDRTLKLVDAVFHLTNDPKHCRYEVVSRNVKVSISDVREPLKKLKNLLEKYSSIRNEIIHHHEVKEDALRRLEMYFIWERLRRTAPEKNLRDMKDFIQDELCEARWFRRKELVGFNDEMAASLSLIFDNLEPYFSREERTLQLRLAKGIV
ncbi:MAG: Cthe_2314 family HEPN domain-containing protein [Bryobacteraceae bacterium]